MGRVNQTEQVIKVLEQAGGIATLGELYQKTNTAHWATKTPFATIRRIVQLSEAITKLKPGLYCLTARRAAFASLAQDLAPQSTSTSKHSYYQAVLLQMGRMGHYQTFLPAQDQNREYLPGKKLADLCDMTALPAFTYDATLRQARTVDVIWFNRRAMPAAFYEVEATTDIKEPMDFADPLQKFCELQDFSASMVIVSDKKHEGKLAELIRHDAFYDIRERVKFQSFEAIDRVAELLPIGRTY